MLPVGAVGRGLGAEVGLVGAGVGDGVGGAIHVLNLKGVINVFQVRVPVVAIYSCVK